MRLVLNQILYVRTSEREVKSKGNERWKGERGGKRKRRDTPIPMSEVEMHMRTFAAFDSR